MAELKVKPNFLKELIAIFDAYCPEAEIWAYGSRINGDSHDGSDLDLTVLSFNNDGKKLGELKSKLKNSNIPFLIDISEFKTLPVSFKKTIEQNHVILYKNK